MTRYLALLRAVNVGQNKVVMSELRDLFATLGYGDARTHLQTGNVIFTAATTDRPALAAEISAAIEKRMGVTSTVLLRSRDELAAVLDADPFAARGIEPARRYLTFLDAVPDASRTASLDPSYGAPDEYALGDRVVYVHCPNGYGRTKLSNAHFERRLNVPATSRGVPVAMKLIDLMT